MAENPDPARVDLTRSTGADQLMKIATYNINGVNGRLPVLLQWLQSAQPDVVCLQELKAPNSKFPVSAINDAGYGAIWNGEKSWNGVAILSRGSDPLETRRGLPGEADDLQSRYLEAAVDGVLIGCLYLPNGNPAPGPKFDYKLRWFERFLTHAESLLAKNLPVVLAGDYNVMPTELDVYKPEKWEGDALFRPEVRERFQRLLDQGWTDAVRTVHPDERIYTFWDYLRNAYGRGAGLRLDHFLLSPQLADRLTKAEVDREVRGWEKSSDHAPTWIELGKAKRLSKKATKVAPKAKAKKATPNTGSPPIPLEKYRQKRNFDKTPEPGARVPERAGKSFVIQEHYATRHHFDFRLEIDGVLVSWAVPKGIPEDLVAKRLAVHVEDHPIEYGSFEGEIPKGNYGAGTVIIWDKGEWEPLETDWRKQYAKGTLKIHLRGDRLNGPYLLARMKEEPNWMLKMLNPATHPLPSSATQTEPEQAKFISPQLAQMVPSMPTGSEWIHEIKYDGYRLIVVKRAGELRVFTRSELDWTDKFKALAKHLSKVSDKDFVLDGEAVVWDENGKSNFGDLQAAIKGRGESISFVVFDLLHFDGENLRNLPLSERLKRLAGLISDEPNVVRRSKTWASGEGRDLYLQACKLGLEGIISKSVTGRYLEGLRRDWSKSKCRPRQEFVICGFTPPKSSLPAFSSVVLGSFENGKWIARGKVGTGFSEDDRVQLLKRFKKLVSKKPLFATDDKSVVWMEPQLVAEIEYAELTRDGSIRQGSFIGLREDKAPVEVQLDGIQTASADNKNAKVLGIKVSHPERMVFPGDHISKMEVVRYFERVGDLMLPFVADRPLSLLRAPSGITGEMFFQKSFPNHVPEHVYQTQLADETTVFHVKDTKGLVSLAQFGMVEIHPWGAALPQGDKPDFLTWDLDPDSVVAWPEVLGTAFLIRDFLADRGLTALVKTSGGKGLHLMVHLKPKYGWDVLKPFSKAVAEAIAAFNPNKLLTTSTKAKRTGKIYIDWMRNGRGATCIAPWALRARPGATVSMPVTWDQLPEIASAGYTIHEPPQTPDEWMNLKAQSITKNLLKEFQLE
jgi:bifunctional non-homologous end joining protein LigD